jgi:hypothetical protein
MPTPLPFVGSYGKVKPLFEKIASAKVPDAFTQKYLSETLGLTSTADRPLIPLLRALGFIDAAGRPSADYAALKNPQRAGFVIAKAIRHAYAPLFAANEKAHQLANDELKGLIAQVAGTDEDPTVRAAGTFKALVSLADPKALSDGSEPLDDTSQEDNSTDGDVDQVDRSGTSGARQKDSAVNPGGIRPEFHYNIQVHLPASGTEETYLNIFNALRKALS